MNVKSTEISNMSRGHLKRGTNLSFRKNSLCKHKYYFCNFIIRHSLCFSRSFTSADNATSIVRMRIRITFAECFDVDLRD